MRYTVRCGNIDIGIFDTEEQAETWARVNVAHRLKYVVVPL